MLNLLIRHKEEHKSCRVYKERGCKEEKIKHINIKEKNKSI